MKIMTVCSEPFPNIYVNIYQFFKSLLLLPGAGAFNPTARNSVNLNAQYCGGFPN